MVWQTILLIVLGSLYALSVVVQAVWYTVTQVHRGKVRAFIWTTILLVLMTPIAGFMWVKWYQAAVSHPEPDTHTININKDQIDNLDLIMRSVGFVHYDWRLSVDNIPYSGYVLRDPDRMFRRAVWVIAIVDDKDTANTTLRLGVYRSNYFTKTVVRQLKMILQEVTTHE